MRGIAALGHGSAPWREQKLESWGTHDFCRVDGWSAECLCAGALGVCPGESLELLRESPVNCLILERPQWQAGFVAAAHARKLHVLAVVDDESVAEAVALGFDGLVVEGAPSARVRGAGKPVVASRRRTQIEASQAGEIVATSQGLWPGVRMEKSGAVEARPSGGPWIETNGGFLRFLHAAVPAATLWMANRVPPGTAYSAQRYIQAVADAAIAGGRWVLDFDASFWEALLQGEAQARAGWARINAVLRFYEEQRALVELDDSSALALVEDARSGAWVSGGILDMIAAKHIPVRPLPSDRVAEATEVKMLLNIDPAGLSAEQGEAARRVARQGATLVNGPPGWKITLPPGEAITFADEQVKQIDEMWREINSLIAAQLRRACVRRARHALEPEGDRGPPPAGPAPGELHGLPGGKRHAARGGPHQRRIAGYAAGHAQAGGLSARRRDRGGH